VAKIIGVAGVRLTVSGKGLDVEIRRILVSSLREASAGVRSDMTAPVREDADRTSRHVRSVLTDILRRSGSVAGGFTRMVASGMKLALIATAAAGALAGITSLTAGTLALAQALVAASGVAALLPAALAGLQAVTATVRIGLAGMDDAMKALNKDAAAFEEAIKDLAPEAQKFMRALRGLQPAFKDLRLDVQNRLFLGLGARLEELSGRYLPLASRLFVTMAGTINQAGHELADFLVQTSTVNQVQGVVDNLRLAFSRLAPSIVPATQALLDVTSVGSTFMPALAESINRVVVRFAEFVRQAAETGQLAAFIERAIQVFQQLGRVAGNVFGIISNVMDAAQANGFGLLDTIERITQAIEDWTGSFSGQAAISSVFETMRRVIDALGPSVFVLVEVLARDFLPILADIAQIMGPVLRPIFEAIGGLLRALRPLIMAIADALGTMLAAFEPVLDALAEAINDAMPTLTPLIEDIGRAFADLIKAMAPLMPVLVDLLAALLPLIPPLIDMVVEIMPELIELVKAIIPIIEAWVGMMVTIIPIFTDIVNFLLNVFVPVFKVISAVISGLYNVISAIIKGIWNVITTVFGAIRDFVVNIWNGISSFFSGIWSKISGVFSGGISDVAGRIGRWAGDMIQKAKDMMGRFVDAIGRGIGNVVQWFKDLPGKVFGAIGDFIGRMVQFGKDLIRGIVDGIVSAAKGVIDAVVNTAKNALAAAKAAIGIASPSRAFREVGVDAVRGLILGIQDRTAEAAEAAAAMAKAVLDSASGLTLDPSLAFDPMAASVSSASGGAFGAAGGAVVLQQTNVMREGADVKQFATEVYRNGAQVLSSAGSLLSVAQQSVQSGLPGPGFVTGVRA
jgi:phage-related protein